MPTIIDLGQVTANLGDQVLVQRGKMILVKPKGMHLIVSEQPAIMTEWPGFRGLISMILHPLRDPTSLSLPTVVGVELTCSAVSMNGKFSVFCIHDRESNCTTVYFCSGDKYFFLKEGDESSHLTKVWVSDYGNTIIAGTSAGLIRTFKVDVEGGFIHSKIQYKVGDAEISFLQVKEVEFSRSINIESCDTRGLLLSLDFVDGTDFRILATTNVPDDFTPYFVDGELLIFEHHNQFQQNMLRTRENPVITDGELLRYGDIQPNDTMRTMIKLPMAGDQELLITLTKGGSIRLWRTIEDRKPGLLLLPDNFRLPENDCPINMTMGIEESGQTLFYVLGSKRVYCYSMAELMAMIPD